jgi:hypothetical protein
MAVKMLVSMLGSSNEYGSETRMYQAGEEIVIDKPWKQALVANFIAAGVAQETKVVKPTETKTKARKRARNEDGTLKGDDPSTPDINEAWETK